MLTLFDDLFTIEGRYVRLEALSLDHLAELTPIALDASVWQYSLKSVKQLTADCIEHYLRNLLQERSVRYALPFMIRHSSTHAPVGVAKYENITPRHERMDVGHIWIGSVFDAKSWLPRILFDLVDHAMSAHDVMRIGSLIDTQHSTLREATERLGFQLEGVLRSYLMYPDGHYGDFASYSILPPEWKALKPGLADL